MSRIVKTIIVWFSGIFVFFMENSQIVSVSLPLKVHGNGILGNCWISMLLALFWELRKNENLSKFSTKCYNTEISFNSLSEKSWKSSCNEGESASTSYVHQRSPGGPTKLIEIISDCNWEEPGGNGNPGKYSCLENSTYREPNGLQSVESQRVQQDWACTQ